MIEMTRNGSINVKNHTINFQKGDKIKEIDFDYLLRDVLISGCGIKIKETVVENKDMAQHVVVENKKKNVRKNKQRNNKSNRS